MIYFKDMNEACHAVTKLKLARDSKEIIVDAVELMDRAALKVLKMTLLCQNLSKILMKM